MRVIISDIDGTVLDVEPRLAAVLRELGVEPGGDTIRVSRTLPRKLRDRFYNLFLSDTYINLDRPIAPAVDELRSIHASTGLPIVYLSGRLTSMRKATRAALEAIGLPFEELILKPDSARMRGTAEWKVSAIREHGYDPEHIFDDDSDVLAALRAAFPAAELHDLSGPAKAVPGGG